MAFLVYFNLILFLADLNMNSIMAYVAASFLSSVRFCFEKKMYYESV